VTSYEVESTSNGGFILRVFTCANMTVAGQLCLPLAKTLVDTLVFTSLPPLIQELKVRLTPVVPV
jgi:hypothetical protein